MFSFFQKCHHYLRPIFRFWTLWVFFLLFSSCWFGAYFAYRDTDSAALSGYLSSVGRALRSNVYLQDETAILDALEAGLRKVDPYFRFLRSNSEFENAFSAFTAQLTAKYGIRFDPKTGKIEAVLQHSSSAGHLETGDIIMSVNGEDKPAQFLNAFKRSAQATIKFLHNSVPHEVQLRPSIIKPVYCELLNDGVAKITLYFFRPEILPVTRDFMETNASKISKIVFDLTQCPGGQVQSLTSFLSIFLPADSAVFVVNGKGTSRVYMTAFAPAYDLTRRTSTTIEILKSHNTASSAEIFAGVLREKFPNRVTLIGETTFGKWTTIQPIKFLRGGIVSSVGKVYLMNGKTFEGIGI